MQPHSSRRIYEGRVVNLRVDEIDAPGGRRRLIEVIEHNGGAVVIARPTPDEIIMVRQYRYPVQDALWELPAGMVDPGETPDTAAARELREETGYTARSLRYLWSSYATPGFCEERWSFYVAEGLQPGEQHLDDNEQIEVRTWRIEDAWRLIEADQLRDAKSQIGLAWAYMQSH
ncbi:MAG TPA: NUDIX hydrolase [Candidatus Acidoferrales bacterium]|nr:NUDIX hydrolase [Candidatus Acidoferrales bacterium]